MLDVLDVVLGALGEKVKKAVALEGGVVVQGGEGGGVHEVIAEFTLAFPGVVTPKQGKVITACPVIRQVRDKWPIRVYVCSSREQVVGNPLGRDPDVGDAKHLGLVDGAVDFAPFVKLEP